ncbi:hypothetical protein I4U23_001505 [Adineta vaga]|nr:hypothetical protein I4U23_001505 [Adineta vaga]
MNSKRKPEEKNNHELCCNDLNKTKFLGLLSTSSLALQTCFTTLETTLTFAGIATLIQQTFLVPIDVVTQRIMITRTYERIRMNDIIRDIYLKSGDGLRGFYKGYLITLGISLPFNSIIWTLYWKIQYQLERFLPLEYDQMISPLSSTIAALLTSLLT